MITTRTAFQSVREGVREYFLLENAEKLAAEDGARRDTVRSYYEAGHRRLNVAQDLRGPVQTPAALTLYRQGTHFLALAYLTSHGRADIDPASVGPQEAFQELDRAFDAEGVDVPAEYGRARSMLIAPDPLDLDRLGADDAAHRVEELETTSRWLSSLIDARTPSELKWIRLLRLGVVVAGAMALLVMLVVRLITPKNLALDKPATASSTALSTLPSGVVDGAKTGTYGFHSALEDSPWVAIDLGRTFAIRKIKVFGRGDGPFDQSVPLALEVSDDGATYQQIGLRTEPFTEYAPWIVEPGPLVTRYLRLKTMRHSYLVLGEVEVNGSVPK